MESNYLIHYGVKGMKWGVRKDIDRVRNITTYGWKKGHGVNVHNRLQDVRRDSSRMKKMSADQRRSLNIATEYWKKRSEGGSYGGRGFIKRSFDDQRSFSASQRAGRRFVTNLGNRIKTQKIQSGYVKPTAIPQAALDTTLNMVGDELFINKMFGHF